MLGAGGLFAFLLVVFPIWSSGVPALSLPAVLHPGLSSLKLGVELFSAISSFVIVGTLARARSPLGFVADRATEIYLVLWVALPLAGDDTFQDQGPLVRLWHPAGHFPGAGAGDFWRYLNAPL